jgi:hypothetical protein
MSKTEKPRQLSEVERLAGLYMDVWNAERDQEDEDYLLEQLFLAVERARKARKT